MDKLPDLGNIEQETGSGVVSTVLARESPMASPRLIAAPDSPPPSVQLPPESSVDDEGPVSATFVGNAPPLKIPQLIPRIMISYYLRNRMSCASKEDIISGIPRQFFGIAWRLRIQRTGGMRRGDRMIWKPQCLFRAKDIGSWVTPWTRKRPWARILRNAQEAKLLKLRLGRVRGL